MYETERLEDRNGGTQVTKLVLLTAAVEPAGVSFLVHSDASKRRDEYRRAVKFYARSLPADKVTLAITESTGASIDDLRHIAARDGHTLHVLMNRADTETAATGKGPAEARMFREVKPFLDESDLPIDYVFKVTGRLRITNIARIVAMSNPVPSYAARLRRDLNYMDTRLFGMDPLTWLSVTPALESDIDESSGQFLEHALFRALTKFGSNAGVPWTPILPAPNFAGVSGSHGEKYGGMKARLRNLTTNAAHRLMRGRYI
jgi:hypothetical protein